MIEIVGLSLIFLTVVVLVFVLLRRTRAPQELASQRLGRPEDDTPGVPPPLLFGPMTPTLAEQLPATTKGGAEIKRELRAGGYYRPTALTEYMALRTILVVTPLVAAFGIAAVVENPNDVPIALGGGMILALLGFSLPRMFVALRTRWRAREIERGLPVAVDLLTLALSAGQNIHAALERVARELRLAFPILASELEVVCQQARLHSLENALMQFADRVAVPEVRNLAQILAQSERLGTDAAATLLEAAANLRITMRQRAEAQANRASFWMLLPTISCFLVAAFIVLAAPAVLELRRQSADTQQMLRGARKGVAESRGRSPSNPPVAAPAPVEGER